MVVENVRKEVLSKLLLIFVQFTSCARLYIKMHIWVLFLHCFVMFQEDLLAKSLTPSRCLSN